MDHLLFFAPSEFKMRGDRASRRLSGKESGLPMQETRAPSLIWEDSTCGGQGATKPGCYNYWACALERGSHNCWAHTPWNPCSATKEACASQAESSRHSPHLESSYCLLQLEKAYAAVKTQHSQKKIINSNFLF